MACYSLIYHYLDLETPTFRKKVTCIGIDLLLLPVISVVIGVVGTVLLLIKIIFLSLAFIFLRIANLAKKTTSSVTVSEVFSCFTNPETKPYLTPFLLLPILGLAIFCVVYIKTTLTKKDIRSLPGLDIVCATFSVPLTTFKDVATSWLQER
ncbi:hypothetical protein [Chlamydia sp. 17-3921]|uniref:hypothetical protein n=1 Tax=Chlamydia sp. 17-3921 TaxID=2675798 RepID=UPI00191ADC81|nr:hypothetical protein [Chlamydia sp. 17-3921]